MDRLAPGGDVYQAGTLSGNPLAMTAGLTVLDALVSDPPYARLDALAASLAAGMKDAAAQAGIPIQQNRVGSMHTLFFTDTPVTDYASAKRSDTARYGAFFHGMLARGVHFAPSQFEACFVSTAHTDADIESTIAAAQDVLQELQ